MEPPPPDTIWPGAMSTVMFAQGTIGERSWNVMNANAS